MLDEKKVYKVSEVAKILHVSEGTVHTLLQDEKLKAEVFSTYNREWLQKAPAIIVVCGVHSESWHRFDGKDHCDIDVAIAILREFRRLFARAKVFLVIQNRRIPLSSGDDTIGSMIQRPSTV